MAGLAVLAVAVAATAVWLGRGEEETAVATFAVKRGPMVISVTESGTIQNRNQEIVKCEVEGGSQILWLVEEGTHVRKGDRLIELDSSRLEDEKAKQQIVVLNAEAAYIRAREDLAVTKSQTESDLAKAELTYKFAQWDLKKYIQGEYPQELQQANAQITIAKEELQRAEDKLEWSRRLAKEGYLTRTELQADELAAKRSQIDLKLAEGKLSLLEEYTNKRNVEQYTSDVEQARMALERVKRKASADIVQAEAELKAKESEYKRQKANLAKTEAQILKCKIFAPVGGMVVYATTGKGNWRGNAEPLDEGQLVRQRQELIHLPTTTSMVAEIKIHESSLRKVAVGQPVRVQVDALPGRTFYGKVGKIGLLPDAQSVWMNPDLKVYNTEIYVDGNGVDLRPGMTCKAQIIVEQYADALYVPMQAVLRVAGRPTVFLSDPDGPVSRAVKIGLDNNRMVRVLEGLAEGEEVLLAPPLAQAATFAEKAPPPSPAGIVGAATSRPTSQPTSQPDGAGGKSPPKLDLTQLRTMTPEQRRKWFQSLTPAQRAEMRKRRPRGDRSGDRPGRNRRGEP